MKKIFLLVIYILSYHVYYSQSQSHNVGVTQPVPSVSSLTTYKNVPVSLQTGVPNILYPLINLPTNNKFVNINLGLSYHVGNISKDSWTGEVGKGWSILGSGAISREILYDFDEVFDDASFHHYIKNEFDDIYNFNIPGESGKFRIVRNVAGNTFGIIALSPYTSKIEYTRTDNTATLILDSFTITSDEGIKYKFQDYNISMMNVWHWDHPNLGSYYIDKTYRSAFYLTSILDQNNQELVKYTYLKDIKYITGTQATESQTNKLTRIEVKDRGIVEINYTKNELVNKKNDIFNIDNIILKNVKNAFIKKYKFNYSYTPDRTLNSFTQVDSYENDIEKTSFDYQGYSLPSGESQLYFNKLRIKLPTGGVSEYDFESVPYAFKDSLTTVMPPQVDIANISFNQFNPNTKKYFFTIPQDKALNIEIFANQISGYPWSLSFFKKVGDNYNTMPYTVGPVVDADRNYPTIQPRTLTAGEYYVTLSSAVPNATFSGSVNFRAFYYDGTPSEVIVKVPTASALRIKNIKSFDLNYSNVNNFSVPSGIEEYEYNKFDDPAVSSGYFVEGGSILGKSESGVVPANPVTIYKNVKVSKGNNTGYTKYYFKTVDAYPTQPTEEPNRPLWPNYNIMREGLLDKKEVYNAANQKQTEDNFEYTFEEFSGPRYLVAPINLGANFFLKTAWVKNQKVLSKTIFNSGSIQTTSETVKNTSNYKTSLEKNTSFDGSIQETAYQYALDKNNQKLINANMLGFPLEITTITRKNSSDAGKLLSRAETKYDNPAHYFPSSILSYDSQNNLDSEVIFSRYDAKGNLEEYTTKDGITVSVVWGYNKTQPIAKIEGASYSQIAPYISDLISKSDMTVVSEQDLQNSLDTFRNNANLSNYQITTYLFDSLNRMKTMTPPTGVRAVYQYDAAGRLQKVEDETGKVLKKYEYNYGH
ncbi:hypothetical protein A1704_19355 [Chryseobacterium cucumeris]|uniref:RHS repeat domain-containing protein n=1 Tax=Chryseobacterium cucumeris TaxID=1813611 RepID=UPI000788CBD4|nr:RHS repeat domain-containing protein [Chryseobacterium cucumeris]KYH03929.1 hypothetical protein A1704_19355 [Chryseobacterium cucumeris]